METKANYVIVGIFTLVVILAAFGFVYWTATVGERGEVAELRIRIPGSASGLGRGSAVLFNGVKVGDVERVYLDLSNPSVAIADTKVDRLAPITDSTSANVGLAGLTGQANIELKGGDPGERNLLDVAEEEGTVAEITARPSAVANLLETAQSLMTRADSVISELEGFMGEARGPFLETVRNVESFSEALEQNSDGIDDFLASAGELSETLSSVSGRLDGTLASAQDLIDAVDREKVAATVDNVERFTGRLDGTLAAADELIASVDREKVAATVDNLERSSGRLDNTLAAAEGLVESFDREKVAAAVDNVERLTGRLDGTITAADELIGAVDREKVAATLDNVERFTGSLESASDDLEGVMAGVDRAVKSINAFSDNASKTLAGVDETVKSIGTLSDNANTTLGRVDGIVEGVDPADVQAALANFREASATVNRTATEVAKVSETISNRSEDIDEFITDASQLAQRLNAASTRVDGVLAKLDGLLGSEDAEGVIAEANSTFEAFRQVAETLNARVNTVSDGLERFSGQGLREVEALVRESRRSIGRIERAITSLEQNPQRIITGGEGSVRRYDGRSRR